MPASHHRPAERDEVYYWDTVRFLVDGIVFKLPRYQFIVGSEYFAKTYLQDVPNPCSTPPIDAEDLNGWDSMDVTNAPRLRASVAGAVVLEDVSADQFRVFLKLLFPIHTITTTLELTKPEWLTVLALSTRWHFLELRRLAMFNIHPQLTDPVEMITVGRREYVREWVESGCERLVRRKQAISEEESESIGWKTAVRLYILRHEWEEEINKQKATGVPIVPGWVKSRVGEKLEGELRVLDEEESLRITKQEREKGRRTFASHARREKAARLALEASESGAGGTSGVGGGKRMSKAALQMSAGATSLGCGDLGPGAAGNPAEGASREGNNPVAMCSVKGP